MLTVTARALLAASLLAHPAVSGAETPELETAAIRTFMPQNPDEQTGCGLLGPRSDELSTAACVECHGRGRASPGSGHPVDVDYTYAAARRSGGMGLRPPSQVVSRGVFLPDGIIRCQTCHDGRSPWKYHLALPSGANVAVSVNPRDPSTYEEGPALSARRAALTAQAAAGLRPDVSPKPLCLICHAAD